MLPAGQASNKGFFAGTVTLSIIDDKVLSRPKVKASGLVLHLDNVRLHITSDKYDKVRIKRPPHPLTVRTELHAIVGYSDILSNIIEDDSSTMISIKTDMFVIVFAE
jgi:hypothetical protein